MTQGMRQRRLRRRRPLPRPLRPKAPPRRIVQRRTQRTMQRVKRRTKRLRPSFIILRLLRPALQGPAVRLLATGRRQGQHIRRQLSPRRPNHLLPISLRQCLNPVRSLRRRQAMGLRRNERKSFGGLRPRFQPTYAPTASRGRWAKVGHPSGATDFGY